MNLENPVALLPFCVEASHLIWIVGVNVQGDFIPGDFLVGKLTDQMSCDGPAIFPAEVASQFLRVPVEFDAGDFEMCLEVLFAFDEGPADVIAKLQLKRVGTQYEGSSEIGFPLFEHRPQIKEDRSRRWVQSRTSRT